MSKEEKAKGNSTSMTVQTPSRYNELQQSSSVPHGMEAPLTCKVPQHEKVKKTRKQVAFNEEANQYVKREYYGGWTL